MAEEIEHFSVVSLDLELLVFNENLIPDVTKFFSFSRNIRPFIRKYHFLSFKAGLCL